MHRLIEERILPYLGNDVLACLTDSALVEIGGARLAFTTDSFVVKPLFFPGGDLGKLAVSGTVNDLAVAGARPVVLSSALILEEGFRFDDLEKLLASMRDTAREAGVRFVTGDTKVVERGKGDGIFVNTAGIGSVPEGRNLAMAKIRPGDAVLLTGGIAEHGIAVLSAREGIPLETPVLSDCAPLNNLLEPVLMACPGVRFMRDPTRGGVASTLNEIAAATRLAVVIVEEKVPLKEEVKVACEILGFDPLHVANEGKAVIVVAPEEALEALSVLRGHPLGREAEVVGRIECRPSGRVLLETSIGGTRVVEMHSGESLPRIC